MTNIYFNIDLISQYFMFLLTSISFLIFIPRLIKIFNLYVFNGADLRSPFIFTTLCILLVNMCYNCLDITINISHNTLNLFSLQNVSLLTILLLNYYNRIFGYICLNEKNNIKNKIIYSVSVILIYLIINVLLIQNEVFIKHKNVINSSFNTHSIILLVILFIFKLILSSFIIKFDLDEKRTKRTIIYDALIIIVDINIFLIRIISVLFETTDFIQYFIRTPIYLLNYVLLILYLHKESQSVIRRAYTELYKTKFIMNKIDILLFKLKIILKTDNIVFNNYELKQINNIYNDFNKIQKIKEICVNKYCKFKRIQKINIKLFNMIYNINELKEKYDFSSNSDIKKMINEL